jgi:SAM-dependent methyltransferase
MTERDASPPVGASARRCLSQRDSYRRSSGIEEFRVPALHAGILAAMETATALLDDLPRTCLDVGCGRQPLKARLVELGFQYDSCDVVQNLDGTVNHVFPFDEPLPEEMRGMGYSLLICTEVFEHVLNWQQAFENADQLLTPGGAIVITTPFFYPLHEEPYDYWRPTHHALLRMCVGRQWQVRHLDRQNEPWDVIGTLMHSVGAAPIARLSVAHMCARTTWRCLKFLTLCAARSRVVRSILPLTGNIPMGTIMVAQKPRTDSRASWGASSSGEAVNQ